MVDNGGQWTHREWRVLRYLGVECDIIPNDTPPEKITAQGLVLSGGCSTISAEDQRLGNSDEYISLGIPILGICAGAQYIARHFGGSVGEADHPEYGKTLVHISDHDEIFKGLPGSFTVWESHNDEIKDIGEELLLLASSTTCRVQAFKHIEAHVYGLQFHPEVEHTEYGPDIFKNFLRICKETG